MYERNGNNLSRDRYEVEIRIGLKQNFPKSGVLKLGFSAEVIRVQDCRSIPELADLLLQSSCTPPFVTVMRRNGRATLDGGLVDNVPVQVVDDRSGDMLVLLTRPYPRERIPQVSGRHYIQPSQPIVIEKWDYTNPEGLQAAYDLGLADGKRFMDENRDG